ncbi:hypothetical protein ACFQU9_03415 [Actinomadura namibiensis]|uniref:D-alanine-D-alanine ligase n=1 Tax=Actinomadura namibiensis TaxID=182080 RepID=A0A7W3LYG9_ACTNM|nr:hypothetical protein [Actinomadura namibiensis]MBA8956558.1 D-alanine-D-alanine ligase [Actinomadura namibiensis]
MLDIAVPTFIDEIREVDVAFLAIAGQYAEDGKLQGLLEMLGVPYTGSGVLASAQAMHKPTAKKRLDGTIARPIQPWVHCTETQPTRSADAFAREWTDLVRATLKLPVVVKPASQGCSIDLHLARDDQQLHDVFTQLAPTSADGQELVVEPYIQGRHLSCGVLEIGGEPVPLPPLEVVLKGELYDHASKQHPEAHCVYHCPAPLPEPIHNQVSAAAVHAHQTLGCHGYSRSDFIADHDGQVWWLETNTLPGLTPTGNLATMATAAGIDHDTLIERILQTAADPRHYRP